jgi:uncharacterized glyoxalase superfamily protein PhnB
VLDQVNLVVRDMDASLAFYRLLGLDALPTTAPWDAHHRTLPAGDSLDFDLDSTTFAKQWNTGSDGRAGVVLGFRVASSDAVDELYAHLMRAGYRGQQPPYDAFWGSRYAIVSDPDGNAVGLMSPADPERRSPPPSPE